MIFFNCATALSGWLKHKQTGLRRWAIASIAISLACIIAPYAAGVGYGIALWPAYEIGCANTSGERGSPDNYRIFLLGHGCDATAAFDATARGLGVTPERLRALKSRVDAGKPVLADDLLQVDSAIAILGRIRRSAVPCPTDRYDCVYQGLSPFYGSVEHTFEQLGSYYANFAEPAFYAGLNYAASTVAYIAWQGPLQRGGLDLVYVFALVTGSSMAAAGLMKRLARTGGQQSQLD